MTSAITRNKRILIFQFFHIISFLMVLELFFISKERTAIVYVFFTKISSFCPRIKSFCKSYSRTLLTSSVYLSNLATLSTCSGSLQRLTWPLRMGENYIISYILAEFILYYVQALRNIFLTVSKKLNAILSEYERSHMTMKVHYTFKTQNIQPLAAYLTYFRLSHALSTWPAITGKFPVELVYSVNIRSVFPTNVQIIDIFILYT